MNYIFELKIQYYLLSYLMIYINKNNFNFVVSIIIGINEWLIPQISEHCPK